MNFNTPILLIAFNRVDTTQRVFDAIKIVKPKQLFFAVDLERSNDEKILVDNVKKIVDQVNWDCEIKTLFHEENLGARLAVSSAITWFFENVEQGIILEHDCLPNNTFFRYCEELLGKYKDNERVMHIGGNFFQENKVGDASYYFSVIPHIWGWATWRRAWQKYDIDMKSFPEFKKENKINNIFSNKLEKKFWLDIFEKNYNHNDDTWDFQWTYTLFNNNGVAINPNINLVSNIGFGKDSLHCQNENSVLANISTSDIDFPLVHLDNIVVNKEADRYINKNNFGIKYSNFFLKNILKKVGLFKLVKKVYLLLKK